MKDIITVVLAGLADGFILMVISAFIFFVVNFILTTELARKLYYNVYSIFTILTTIVAISIWDIEIICIWLGFTLSLIIYSKYNTKVN